MLRGFFLSLLLLFATAPAEAQHTTFIAVNPIAAVPPPSSCPFGTVGAADNGCSGAIAGAAGSSSVRYMNGRQPGDMINQLTASPTNYVVNGPVINLPGIDYSVGEPLSLVSLDDPVSGAAPLTSLGCTYNATQGPASNPVITCNINGTANLTIDAYDFTRGGTTCVALRLTGSTTGTIIATRNNWKNNGVCNVDQFGTPMVSESASLSSSHLVFEYNTLDGNGLNFPYDFYGACPAPTVLASPVCSPAVAYVFVGDAVVEYNAILNFTARTLQYVAQNVSYGHTFKYNLVLGCCTQNPAAHGEFEEYGGNPGGAGQIFVSNTFIDPTSHHNTGDGLLPAQFTTANIVQIMDVENNFIVAGPAGGGARSMTYAGSVSGGAFTTSAITAGPLGSGLLTTCGTSPNDVTFMNDFPGSTGTVSAGPGGGGNSGSNQVTTWPITWTTTHIVGTLDNGSGGSGNTLTVTSDLTIVLNTTTTVGISGNRAITAMSPSINPDTGLAFTGTGGAGTYGVAGAAANVGSSTILATPANIFPGGWSVPGTVSCASQTEPAIPFTRAITDIVGPMGQITNKNNFWDGYTWGPSTAGHVNDNRGATLQNFNGTIAGNILTVNSGTNPTLGFGFIAQAGIPAGTVVVSGTAPTFTLSASLGSVGPVAMQTSQTYCTVGPTIWGGNVDMAGIYNSTLMNSYIANIPGNGC